VTLKELIVAFQQVVARAEMFAHHHVQREALSVRERMSQVLFSLEGQKRVEFVKLLDASEGRMGVTVTFLAVLELLKESLIEVVQAEPFGPIHVSAAGQPVTVDDSSERA
jgi:segregation and condensation protein A